MLGSAAPAESHHVVGVAGGAVRTGEHPAPAHVLHHLLRGEAGVGLARIRKHLPGEHPERPDVRLGGEVAVEECLEGEPPDGHGVGGGAGSGGRAGVARQPEVADLHSEVRGHEAVACGEVAVDVAEVREVRHGGGDVTHEAQLLRDVGGVGGVERAAVGVAVPPDVVSRPARRQPVVEGPPRHVLEQHARGRGAACAHAAQTHDVRVSQRRQQRRLLHKVLSCVRRRVRSQHLHRDRAEGRRRRREDATEGALAQLPHVHDVIARTRGPPVARPRGPPAAGGNTRWTAAWR